LTIAAIQSNQAEISLLFNGMREHIMDALENAPRAFIGLRMRGTSSAPALVAQTRTGPRLTSLSLSTLLILPYGS
jgi:hypothetical protein